MYICLIYTSQINPSATAAADVGFGADRAKGSVQYVALSDIKSGKVKLPAGSGNIPNIEGLIRSSDDDSNGGGIVDGPDFKGFGKR